MSETAKEKRDRLIKEAHMKYENDKREWEKVKADIDYNDMLDDDGYPTDAALEMIERWHYSDTFGWMEFIKSIWWAADWGWTEGEEPHEWREGSKCYRYHISTGGWSGNESIIRAMQKNDFHWYLIWVQSRRGGHYIFERRDFDE
mgnify:FL=1|jgi:hypothetical protein